MKRIAIITARGGSKRIPRKNIKNFCGKPIICYSIKAALDAGIFDVVMVSTDDKEIADIAVSCGAAVPFMRSEDTSGDFATTVEVLREVLIQYEKQGQFFDEVCCIYPTAPFVTKEKLRQAVQLLEDKQADNVTPVVRFSYPPQRCYVIAGDTMQFKWPEYRSSRSQDLEPYYHDCGQYYVYKTEALTKKKREEWRQVPLITSELEVQDIDHEEDWKIAELKYQAMEERVAGNRA